MKCSELNCPNDATQRARIVTTGKPRPILEKGLELCDAHITQLKLRGLRIETEPIQQGIQVHVRDIETNAIISSFEYTGELNFGALDKFENTYLRGQWGNKETRYLDTEDLVESIKARELANSTRGRMT